MNNLNELSKQYNELRQRMDDVEGKASYYESYNLEYKGVKCYISDLNLYFGKAILRVYDEFSDRFDNSSKTTTITLEEFDKEVTVIKEEN